MKVYHGKREGGECIVTTQTDDGPAMLLGFRTDLRNHSPTGFEWGYNGSGPAQLALAILADFLGDDSEALRKHQGFKFEVVSKLSADEWWMCGSDVELALAILEAYPNGARAD